jgi:hypothetical protein
MAVSIRNVEKYFKDHPELASIKDRCMESIEADGAMFKGIISGGTIEQILGPRLAAEFFQEVTSDTEHVIMGLEDLKKVQ